MKSSIVKTLLIQLGFVFVVATILIGYLWIKSEYDSLAEENDRYRAEFLATQKGILSSEVRKIKNFLLLEKEQAEHQLKQQIRERVEEAHSVADNLYKTYKDSLSESDIKKLIFEALRSIRFNNQRGYYFILSLNRQMLLFPPKPAVEGHPAEEVFSPKGVAVTKQAADIVTTKGEGFFRYQWPLPYDMSRESSKYSYVKLFQPYGWIIGTGDYIEEVEKRIKEEIFKRIAKIRYGLNDEGYFFINSYTGDLYVTNGQYFGGKKNIWDVQDVNGKKVVQENARLAQAIPQGGFSEYVWKKNTGEEAAKISYILGMDEWKIFIGTGAYIDTLEKEIERREDQLAGRLQQRIISAVGIYLIAIILVYLTVYFITRKLANNFSLFHGAFEQAADNRVRIDTNRVFFKEFRQLAHRTNKMIDTMNLQAERLRHQAHHDHLTALPNRGRGLAHLAKMTDIASQMDKKLALLFIDIDDFKEINDTLGHSVGDRLLQIISDRLIQTIRENDAVARLGGDEFMVITGVLPHAEDAAAIAVKLLNTLQKPFFVEDNAFHISASIGICIYPDDADDAETMLRNADSAMYHAKRTGKNSFMFYHDKMTREAEERAALLDDLRNAVAEGQFELYFQAQSQGKESEKLSAEALIRWVHPQRGTVLPSVFIPLAESSGLIHAIGKWVIRQSCQAILRWRRAQIPIEYIAVNISARQLLKPNFGELLADICAETDIPASSLELEITETVAMESTQSVMDILSQLKAVGLRLSIDDFGTGYSSLSRLKQLPFNKIKIDSSFIRDLEHDENDRAIVQAIIGMGNSLNLEVIAEGVENKNQETILNALGCQRIQGNGFAEPMPEKRFLAFVCSLDQR